MFCSKCGTENTETATACVKCGVPIVAHHSAPSQTAEAVKGASKDALEALKIFAANPVPGLPKAFEHLGPQRALGAGIGFGVVASLCLILGMIISWRGIPSIGIFFKTLLFSFVPYASLAASCFGANLLFRGKGGIPHACFIAGAASLPFGIVVLANGMLGPNDITSILAAFALTTSILLLFSGCIRILGLSEGAATIALPVMIIIAAWLTRELLFRAIYSGYFRASVNVTPF